MRKEFALFVHGHEHLLRCSHDRKSASRDQKTVLADAASAPHTSAAILQTPRAVGVAVYRDLLLGDVHGACSPAPSLEMACLSLLLWRFRDGVPLTPRPFFSLILAGGSSTSSVRHRE